MTQILQKRKVTSPKTIFGLATLAVVGSGLCATTAEASTPYTVTASSLNVRSGASTSSPILGSLSKNQSVSVSSISNGWAKISYNGKTAYVSSSYLSESNSSGNNSNSSNTSTYYVNASGLNVRSGAGTSYSILGSLAKNQSISVSSISNGWAKISYNGKTAYVSASYLSESSSSSNSSGNSSNSSNTSTHYVNASGLNVRSGAGTSYSILGSLSKNQSVSVSSISNGWAKISYNGKTAYVSASYLSESSSSSGSSGNSSNSSSASTYYVNASGLNVRSGAGTSYSIIGSLANNQSVSVSSISNGWATIDYNGRTAYVSSSYLSASSSSGSNSNSSSSSVDAAAIVSYAQQFIGVPYVWGGSSPNGFDCSGYIYYVLKQNGISISRTNVSGYWNNNTLFQTVSSPQTGDIIFFQGTYTSGPSHIGFMINSTQFIHASSSGSVMISDISNTYWTQHFLGYKRLK